MKFLRNNFALFFLAALAVGGVVYLGWAIGASVNCFSGNCFSTNGQTDFTSPVADVFTGENDTASIESVGPGTDCASSLFQMGGGNDVAYIRDPQTATAEPIQVEGQSGDDVIVNASTQGNCLVGGDGNDFLADGDAAGTLTGGDGNDLLAGGQGNDTLNGGNGNDVLVGGPGTDTYTTAANDGDDIVIIHRGDAGTESYTCFGNDTILLFGFERDGVVEIPTPTTSSYTLTDPVTGGTYTFSATGSNKCTIIFVE
jgi:Ca2+-binding RTX toxin-like protein